MIAINTRFLTQRLTGVQRFAFEICRRLKRLDDEIVFVAPHNILQKDEVQELGVKVIGTHTGHLWEQWDLPRWCKNNGSPLLVNLCNTAPLCYGNKISTVHDLAFEVFPQTFSKSFLYLYKFLIPRSLKSSRQVVTVSKYSKQEIIKYYSIPQKNIHIIYNSVSDEFKSCQGEAQERYFLAVSSLNYRKNFIYILEAFKQYQQTDKGTFLYIVGDLKTKSFGNIDLAEYQNNKQIKFLGRVSDEELIRLYGQAQCFIYPSLYEGFGIPPLEAQACGCPAICADASCLPEVFGDTVLYCNPYKPETLVECIKKINDNRIREHLIEKGRENVKRYSWEESAKRMYKIIKAI